MWRCGSVVQIRDDPVIRCMERCGYPPWLIRSGAEEHDSGCRETEEGGRKDEL